MQKARLIVSPHFCPDYIRLIPAAEFSRDILTVTLQDGHIDLLHPDFNLTSVKTDSQTIAAESSLKIIRLATPFNLGSSVQPTLPWVLQGASCCSRPQ